MKQFLLITLLIGFVLTARAQETHTPQYKCFGHKGEQFHILIGNSFPQIPDLDFSDEVIVAKPSQTHYCPLNQDPVEPAKYTLVKLFDKSNGIDNGNFLSLHSFRTNPITLENGTLMEIELIDGEIYYEVFTPVGCSEDSCRTARQYHCEPQLGILRESCPKN